MLIVACTSEHAKRLKSNLIYVVGMKHMIGIKVKRKSFLCGECLGARRKRKNIY